ncbi:hypothetical protein BBD42_01925 [Paenibacillus sp. BIHB 4019]|uniref:Cohesin domain-containing protein n=1 Tax=Paenibacillus sp. BIHB 4019 TaxID=1870819 RepID=A0A1B2DCE9_9BACL|nr:hypothetical protein [Paenibacillus sp. BIHB 4019]ANY65365.1 hypothetical protein BBD42_01925 [Paenibacillus sp. BIHB 4019]
MKKKWMVISLLLVLLAVNGLAASANESSDVSIIVNSDKEQYDKEIDMDVTVEFHNNDLYNSQTFLSYHIYDESDTELLWEGQRFPLTINSQGVANINLLLNVSTELGQTEVNHLKVRFDLVDEKNLYWFSTNPKVKLSTEEIIMDKDPLKRAISAIKSPLKKQPIIFFVNVAFFLLFIVLFIRFRKSQLFI